ncbi:hypothetical protein TNCV_1536331 [Trichonephila clavipes]|nr:hypothetical protein TNCV_1536331 [Trichonephila clavipes]
MYRPLVILAIYRTAVNHASRFRIRALVNRIAYCVVWGEEPPHDCEIPRSIGIDGVSRTDVIRRTHRSKIGGNFTEGKRIFTLSHAYDVQNNVHWQTMYHYVKSGFPQHYGNSSQNVRWKTFFRCKIKFENNVKKEMFLEERKYKSSTQPSSL